MRLILFAALMFAACTKDCPVPDCEVNRTAVLTVTNVSAGVLDLHVNNDPVCELAAGHSMTITTSAAQKQIGGYIRLPNGKIQYGHENIIMEPCGNYAVSIDVDG